MRFNATSVVYLLASFVAVGCTEPESPIVIAVDDVETADDSPADVSSSGPTTDAGPDTDSESAPPDMLHGLAECDDSLAESLNRLDAMAPSRGADAPVVEVLGLDASVRSLFSESPSAPDGYFLCASNGERRLIPEVVGAPLIVVRETGRPLVLEHPHPFFDGTMETVQAWWETTNARTLLVAGAHRCSSSSPSSCDGTTSVCSDTSAPYPTSDPAHSTTHPFHRAHVALADAVPDALIVSLHGTGQDVAYISDGTRGRGPSDNTVAAVATSLNATFAAVGSLSCDSYDGSAGPWLCGTSNVQGRHLNGSSDACTQSPVGSSGRFLHLEQPRAFRDAPQQTAEAFVRALTAD